MKYCQHCMSTIPDNAAICEKCHQSPTVQSPPHHLTAGTVLNQRYLIGEAIGEGGFGITYVGFDLSLELKVAVKEFYPHGYANRNNSVSNDVSLLQSKETDYFNNARDHFIREAKSIAKFSKEPAIVDVRDYFTENNTAYIVMEYIEGITLSTSIKRYGAFESNDIFSRITPLTLALDKMHRQGVIHRDISPENIMITSDGTLKLMDFGSARYFAGENKRTMSVVLKPGYAPFEQYSTDGNQGPWTDVYALCATLYKCITDITPPDAMSRCQHDSLKAPSAIGISISPRQERVLLNGLRIDPTDRLQSIEAMLRIMNDDNHEPSRSDIDDRTMVADQNEPVHSAEYTYGDSFSRMSVNRSKTYPDKKHTGLIIAVVLLVAVLVIGGITAYVFLHRSTNDNSNSSEQNAVGNTDKVIVPDVTGKKYSDAETELKNLGLTVEATYEVSDSVAKDYVIRQSIEAERQLNRGDSVMLYVSDGPENPEDEPDPTEVLNPTQDVNNELNKPTVRPSFDVDSEVEHIRSLYYAAQEDPGSVSEENGVQYYRKNGQITKIVCPSGYDNWNYSRMYYYDNGELYFAFVFDGDEEHRLYFADGTLIRYIDNNGTVYDYGSIDCPFESRVVTEANSLI